MYIETGILEQAKSGLRHAKTLEEVYALRYLVLAFRAGNRRNKEAYGYGWLKLLDLLEDKLDAVCPKEWLGKKIVQHIELFNSEKVSSPSSTTTLAKITCSVEATPSFGLMKKSATKFSPAANLIRVDERQPNADVPLPAGKMFCYQLFQGKPLIWHRFHNINDLPREFFDENDDKYDLKHSAFQFLVMAMTDPHHYLISSSEQHILYLYEQIKSPVHERIEAFICLLFENMPHDYQKLNVTKKAQFIDSIINTFRSKLGLESDDEFIEKLNYLDQTEYNM